jgi:hypothetical protein
MSAQPAQQLFLEVEQFIAEGRALLDQGALMELAGLDEQVRILCDRVLQLSQEERLVYADKLQKLLGDLTALGETMAQKRDLIAEEIRGLSHHKKASTAYRVADSRDDFGERDEGDE